MRKLALLLMIAVALSSCDENKKDKPCNCEQAFQGNHQLALQNDPSVPDSGSYMIVTNNVAKFMWKGKDSSYVISTIEIGKVRVQIDETVTHPYVKFRWTPCMNIADIQQRMRDSIVYVVLVCSSKDCPIQIGIKSTPEQAQL